MKILEFLVPTHKMGTNLTVRRGVKWDFETHADIPGLGECPIYTKVMPFSYMTDVDVCIHEHDPSCRTLKGLKQAMLKAYPKFDEREIVTLVYYDTKDVIKEKDLTKGCSIGTIVDKSKATIRQEPLVPTPYYRDWDDRN